MILAAAALAGFAVLALEVLGVHWLAPWFGTSALVWSNQIGVVLLAMALGGWFGGRQARGRVAPLRLAGALLTIAGVLVGAGLWLLPLIARSLLPAELTLDEAAAAFLGGSLGSALLLFAPPVFLMSMVSPLLVEERARRRGATAGEAAGAVAAAGTLGSLAGVFGSTLVAIPMLGTRTTLALTSVALLLAGIALLRGGRPRGRDVAALGLLALLLPVGARVTGDPARTAHLPAGAEVLAVVETPLQRLRVIEWPNTGERWLQMNEGLDSYQSRWHPDAATWPGGYYDLFALAPVYAGAVRQPAVHFWVLGFGAGTALMPVAETLRTASWRATGVEIDDRLTDLVAAWMPLAASLAARTRIVSGGDARAFLRAAPEDLDFILVDTYTNQFEIPLHLATEEFFGEVHAHLRAGGVVAVNLGTSERPGSAAGFVDAVRAALGVHFGEQVRVHRVARSRNRVVFARKDEALPGLAETARFLPPSAPASLAGALLPGQTVDGVPSEVPFRLTDDRNPLALAQARVWLAGEEDAP